jgi:hypothetical protein
MESHRVDMVDEPLVNQSTATSATSTSSSRPYRAGQHSNRSAVRYLFFLSIHFLLITRSLTPLLAV